MATLVNKMNREVKVIIPNMREFRTFYSDNEGVIGMFFKRDWTEEATKQQEHWKPSEEQMEALKCAIEDIAKFSKRGGRQVEFENEPYYMALHSLYCNLEKLM